MASKKEVFDPAICARCAALGATCCTLTSKDGQGLCFPLSAKEVERIKEFLCSGRKADVKDFAVAEPNDKIFVRELRRLLPGYPVSEVFQTSGSHWRLKTAGNDCVFLTKSGCLLPRECRPLYCRLFPFWIFGGKIVLMDAVNCLGAHEAVSVQEALKLFRVSADEISALFHHMMISWGLK